MALQCNLTCAAKIAEASHPKDYRGLCNPHLTRAKPSRRALYLPSGLPYKNVD
jgi:hypothetical protein